MRSRVTPLIVAVLLLCGVAACVPTPAARSTAVTDGRAGVSLVPQPRFVRAFGAAFVWPKRVRIRARSPQERRVGNLLAHFLAANGVSATIESDEANADVRLEAGTGRAPGVGSEGYVLGASRAGVRLEANTGAGLFYGLQSLEQLSVAGIHGLTTPGTTVRDWPRYAWRGMQLDVSRHFFAPAVVERFIDVAAHYKFNVFQWHLTDDQAWRIAIPRYPRLTRVGACQAGTCAYYTLEQIREVVRYARDRYVTIVPEIEVPGHSEAALRAYPQYGCDRAPGTGVYCPTQTTFTFLQNVLAEVAALFPSPYVHLGGDEVDPAPWRRSAYVRALMRRERFTTFPQVQGYITRRLQAFLHTRGKRLAGWDEILQPGVARSAIVTSWRGTKMVVAAVRGGNDVVVATDGPLYFDAFQGERVQEPPASPHMATLAEVYDFDPTPDGLEEAEARRILGAQGSMWTEHIASPEHLFYMAFPRELALSEIVWTPSAEKNWASFLTRLPAQLAWLERNHYPFRIPAPRIAVTGGTINFVAIPGFEQRVDARTDALQVRVKLNEPVRNALLRYTTDGSEPSAASPAYSKPLRLRVNTPGGVRLAVTAFLSGGRRSSTSRCAIRHGTTRWVLARRNASHRWDALVSP